MVKEKYKKRRRQKKIPWYVTAREEAIKRGEPQQWEQIEKQVEAKEKKERENE